MTYLQIVNAVLRRLRENEVTTVNSTSYSRLIGDFVNEIKREVEDANDWNRLRITSLITTSSGSFSYSLTGAGERFKILQVWNDTEDYELVHIPYKTMNALFLDNNQTKNMPMYWDLNGSTTSGDPIVNIYPIPDTSYQINFNMVVPQADFSADEDDCVVPSNVVVLGAYARALEERGEDAGGSAPMAELRYREALSDAIALDIRHRPEEIIWSVC